MDLIQLCEAVGGTVAEVLKGSACGEDEPLTALTIVPDSARPADTFAIIFSVSHVIIDGFTYYQLLSMLSAGGTMNSLSMTRKHEISTQSAAAIGLAEIGFSYSKALICNVVCSMMFGSKSFIEAFYVDDERVKAAKANPAPGVDFVSTNDVITSAFANVTDARVLMMPLNFRNRLAGFTDTDAGNYEGALVFGPDDYAEPAQIRRTLLTGPPQFVRGAGDHTRPLPGCCESMRCKISMVTNWCFPCFSEIMIPGCEQMLHTPYCDANMVPFDVAVVYRPKRGKLAVACFVRSASREELKAGCPIGASVSCAEDSLMCQ